MMTHTTPTGARLSEAQWISPDDAIADRLFEIDQEVEAECKDGITRRIYFGFVSDEDGGDWTSFYDGDGLEVFNDDIKRVRAITPAGRRAIAEQDQPTGD